MNRKLNRLAFTGLLAGVLVAGGGMPARAAPALEASAASVTAAAACKAHPVRPVKVGSNIRSASTFSGCRGTVRLMVQRLRWGGRWETIKAVTVPVTGRRTTTVSCRGSGTFTYRTLVHSRNLAGRPKNWTSSHLRVRC